MPNKMYLVYTTSTEKSRPAYVRAGSRISATKVYLAMRVLDNLNESDVVVIPCSHAPIKHTCFMDQVGKEHKHSAGKKHMGNPIDFQSPFQLKVLKLHAKLDRFFNILFFPVSFISNSLGLNRKK